MFNKSFLRINKRNNKIISRVNQVYTRKDIWCGSEYCKQCYKITNISSNNDESQVTLNKNKIEGCKDCSGYSSDLFINKSHYLILDSNTVIEQFDVISKPKLFNIILLQTVLNEVKEKNIKLFNKLRNVMKEQKERFYTFYNEYSEYVNSIYFILISHIDLIYT